MTASSRRVVQLILVVATVAAVVAVPGRVHIQGQGTQTCGMQKNGAPVIFCETFDQPSAVFNRSGQLNGTLWGASRLTGAPAPGGPDNWAISTIDSCNGSSSAQPDATDVVICNGRLREVTFDNFTTTVLAMYPKQPFDFTGRTGTVAFDVTNDTSGAHGMWPEFWLTDQPVPAPWTHGDNGQVPCDFCSVPRNGIGIRLAGIFEPNQGGQAPGCVNDSNRRWIVDSMTIVRNYVPSNLGWYGTGSFTSLGCAIASSGPNGLLNHVEIRLSQTTVEVWASDPGQTTLKLIARLDNANLPLTRGLIWIEDSHYNAEKSNFPSTVNHTFTWDNVAFDGPATYRDLSFDVLDRLSTGNLPGTLNLGWDTMPGSPATLTTLPMTAQNIAAATGSLLLMNYGSAHINTWNYTINGHAHSTPTPIAAPISGWQSVALPIPLTDLVAGAQNIQISGDQYAGIANVSIVLVAAATVPGFNPPPAPTNLRLIGELLGLSGRKVWALGTSGLRSSQSYAAR